MRRFSTLLILITCLSLLPAAPGFAWFFGDDTLVTIDGNRYTADDFKRWWKFWNDENLPVPQTPDPYIDFILLAREADRMELGETPGFQRSTRIFLTARGLLMFKYDAVDSQIKITDEQIKARYDEQYLPQWLVQRLEFGSAAEAQKTWEALEEKTLTLEELLAKSPEEGGPVSTKENWLRPASIDPGWTDIFRALAVGEVVNPSAHEGGLILYRLKEQKGGDEEDFTQFKEQIKRELWKEKEDELTLALLQELREKYQVVVDTERLDALDLSAPDESFTDAVLISTTKQNVTEKQFMAVVRKLEASRSAAAHATTDEEKARELKAETVNNILAQSLTNWGAVDQHYEEKEPFKWEYEFNRDHRLVMAMEEAIFLPQATPTDEEIKKYYEENLERYSQPTVVRIQIVDDTQGPVDRIWADVMTGDKFSEAMAKHLEHGVPTQEVPANHLDPEVKVAVDKLAVGETSPIFNAQGSRVVVHLVSRTDSYPLPLDRVAPSIRSKLTRDNVAKQRASYLDQLKSSSQIEVRKRQWKAIQKELGGA